MARPDIGLLLCLAYFLTTSHGRSSGELEYNGPVPGKPAMVYELLSEVRLSEVSTSESTPQPVGYQIHGNLHVGALWQGADGEKLLKFDLKRPRLFIKSRKQPSPDIFVEHSSKLDSINNEPFYASWKLGKIDKIYASEKDPLSILNLKRGLVSLFQFQVIDVEVNETDVSYVCNTHYSSTSPTSFRKVKVNCAMPVDTYSTSHPERLLSVNTDSDRYTDYFMSDDNTILRRIHSHETHKMKMTIKENAGNEITIIQELRFLDDVHGDAVSVKASTIKEAIHELINEGVDLKEHTLGAVKEPNTCANKCPTLLQKIKENRNVFKSSQLGSIKSASVFIQLLKVARQSSADEILKALKSVNNKDILQQLCDLVGFTQTVPAHQAAKKFLNFDSDYDIDSVERYLWALSIGTHPSEEVINDLLKISGSNSIPKKVWETLTLTASAMAYNYAQQSIFGFKHKVVEKVKNHVTYSLSLCNDNECRVTFMRALKNLKHPETLDLILSNAITGQRSVSVAAMKALKAMPPSFWNQTVIKECERILYQIVRKYDSSSRTLAADIILNSRPSRKIVEGLVWFLTTDEKEYEIKQFIYQRLLMISERCSRFRTMLANIIKSDKRLNNWNVLGQRGLTTAFMRPFMNTEWMNGSLVTIQEISGGLLKRGHVDVLIESNGETKELFSLGLFAGGLSSFMGSNSNEDEPGEEETATAGMELTVQGVQLRPFTFFSGQGELMGHMWSGTASERTTAFQALALLHDHTEWIALGNGLTAELSLFGTSSFDLAGEVQLSIWSRIAHSVVEQSAGIAIQGILKADNSFAKSQSEFIITGKPKLTLVSDIDFYSDVSLCMQVKQPDTIVKHNVYKIERVEGSQHKLRKVKYRTSNIPGKTYALNRKNNMMCNVIHNKL